MEAWPGRHAAVGRSASPTGNSTPMPAASCRRSTSSTLVSRCRRAFRGCTAGGPTDGCRRRRRRECPGAISAVRRSREGSDATGSPPCDSPRQRYCLDARGSPHAERHFILRPQMATENPDDAPGARAVHGGDAVSAGRRHERKMPYWATMLGGEGSVGLLSCQAGRSKPLVERESHEIS